MRAEPVTLLPIFDYAKILGLDPLHFAGGYSDLRPAPSCRDIWFQYDWQNQDLVSRHQIASLIAEAERDIADALGYWPAPVWIEDEQQNYPRLYRRDLTGYGQDVRFRYRGMRTKWGYVIEGGQRATALVSDDVVWVGSDPDGDGFPEIATFTINGVDADLDPCEVHMYYKVYDVADEDNTRTDPSSAGADPAWEIKPIHVSLSGTTLTVRCNKWQLFRPQLFEELAPEAIDADDIANYVDATIFYRVYNDPSQQVTFGWAADMSCATTAPCAYSTQSGCLRVNDNRNGLVVPTPATYNDTDGTYTAAYWVNGYEPDTVRLWYHAGYYDPATSCPTLTSYWARTIAMLATARSDWPICTCNNTNNALLSPEWREDMRKMTSDRSFLASARTLDNPFGSRVGEVEAWIRVSKARGRAKGQAVLS